MRVSQYLRRYQIAGDPAVADPDTTPEFMFWIGWLMGRSRTNQGIILTQKELDDYKVSLDQARDMAIKAAEFIESRM